MGFKLFVERELFFHCGVILYLIKTHFFSMLNHLYQQGPGFMDSVVTLNMMTLTSINQRELLSGQREYMLKHTHINVKCEYASPKKRVFSQLKFSAN